MLAEMAAEDIRELQARGVNLTPAQIVRLNDLALRVTRGAEGAAFICAPRVAWAGDTPLYEPSIAAEIWLRDFAGAWWNGRSLTLATAFAAAHGRECGGFWRQRDREQQARAEIEAWQKSLSCTWAQLMAALDYALNGLPRERAENAAGTQAEPEGCPYADVLAECVAAGLGVPIGDLERQPARIAGEYVRRWTRNQIALAGGKPGAADARASLRDWCAYDDYVKKLENLKENTADGEG